MKLSTGTTLASLATLASVSSAAAPYRLTDAYTPANFFEEGFDFYSGPDPTNGFVTYQTAAQAHQSLLAGTAAGGVYLGVDHTTKTPGGRPSTRVESRKSWTHGLFVADISHMPSSTCGVWAAYWMFGASSKWPDTGEIDIIEGVNTDTSTTHTLHTSPGCTFTPQGNCNAPGDGTKGCGEAVNRGNTYGDGFNAAQGGVYAVQWTSEAIKFWFFPRANIPADLVWAGNATTSSGGAAHPDPSKWPQSFQTGKFIGDNGCDIDARFKNHQIVFNTALCGDWAGSVWKQNAQCSKLAATCEQYVAGHPDAFRDANWVINSVRVYSNEGVAAKRNEDDDDEEVVEERDSALDSLDGGLDGNNIQPIEDKVRRGTQGMEDKARRGRRALRSSRVPL